jgi:serine/threonine protein kinase
MYRPPEIEADGEYFANADIWALGVTLIEYFTGKTMIDTNMNEPLLEFNKTNIELIKNHELYGKSMCIKLSVLI